MLFKKGNQGAPVSWWMKMHSLLCALWVSSCISQPWFLLILCLFTLAPYHKWYVLLSPLVLLHRAILCSGSTTVNGSGVLWYCSGSSVQQGKADQVLWCLNKLFVETGYCILWAYLYFHLHPLPQYQIKKSVKAYCTKAFNFNSQQKCSIQRQIKDDNKWSYLGKSCCYLHWCKSQSSHCSWEASSLSHHLK